MIPHYDTPRIAPQGFSVALLPDERRTLDLRRATVDWIAGLAPWRWFCTLTFAGSPGDGAAHEAFRSWARYVARDVYRSHVRIAWSYAPQYRGTLHYHALLAPDVQELVDVATIAAAWPDGRVDVQPVHDAQGAARYLAAHADDRGELRRAWDVQVACDRRRRCQRRRGCVVAPGPWGHPT